MADAEGLKLNTELQVVPRERQLIKDNKKKEKFTIEDIIYYEEMPECELPRPRRSLLPLDDPDVLAWCENAIEVQNARPDREREFKIGWEGSPDKLMDERFGIITHSAVVDFSPDGNLTKYHTDQMTWGDGRVDTETGLVTPGTVIAPIEKMGDEYYVHCFWQYRVAPWNDEVSVPPNLTEEQKRDFIALNRGAWYPTVSGGWAKEIGETALQTAKHESEEESGLKVVGNPTFTVQNFNRWNIINPVRLGFYVFERSEDSQLTTNDKKLIAKMHASRDSDESVAKGRMAVNIKHFESEDGLVNAAVNFALREIYFGDFLKTQ